MLGVSLPVGRTVAVIFCHTIAFPYFPSNSCFHRDDTQTVLRVTIIHICGEALEVVIRLTVFALWL